MFGYCDIFVWEIVGAQHEELCPDGGTEGSVFDRVQVLEEQVADDGETKD